MVYTRPLPRNRPQVNAKQTIDDTEWSASDYIGIGFWPDVIVNRGQHNGGEERRPDISPPQEMPECTQGPDSLIQNVIVRNHLLKRNIWHTRV